MLHIHTKLSALNYSICIFVCYLLSLMLLLICINSVPLHLLVLVYCSRLLFWGEAQEIFSAPKKGTVCPKNYFLEAPFIGEVSHVGNPHWSTQDGYHKYDKRLLQARSTVFDGSFDHPESLLEVLRALEEVFT